MPYLWRKLTQAQRAEILLHRQRLSRPWHRPPHFHTGIRHYILTAACYEHRPHIGLSPERMTSFAETLLNALPDAPVAWCVLPNHYHLLIRSGDLKGLVQLLGRLHGRTSFQWNRDESIPGRKVWHGTSDRAIRDSGHFWATLNYIHHNPVRHGYAEAWQDWPWSSASDYLSKVGKKQAETVWKDYPILEYGKGWDDPAM
jgi:putative transposase